MANKKFLYGLGLGIIGSNVYPLLKDKLRPMAVKLVEGAIVAGSSTKSFLVEVNEKAMQQREERFKKAGENIEPKHLNSSDEVSENIEVLKKQIEELKSKINGS